MFQMVRGEVGQACAQAEHLLHLAQRDQDATRLLQGHLALGASLLFRGALPAALEHLTHGSRLYHPQHHHARVAIYGLDLGVDCRTHAAFARCCLGYPDPARQQGEEALALAGSLAHPHTTAQALTWLAGIHHGRGEVDAAGKYAEAVVALAWEQEFPYWLSFGLLVRGWALAVQGQEAAGCDQMRQDLRTLQATGTVCCLRFGITLLAEAYGRNGEVERGLATVTEVLRTLDHPGDRLWDAELYRVKGELTLIQSGVPHRASRVRTSRKSKVLSAKSKTPNTQHQVEAEACFLKALEVARGQGAKAWELRAATSLARLRQHQGKRVEARQLLAEIYGWFTEGFDTADLQEAKALLSELSNVSGSPVGEFHG
jgi:predicted ATPase